MRPTTRITTSFLGILCFLLAGCGVLQRNSDDTKPSHPGFASGKLADYTPTKLGSPKSLQPNGGTAILCQDGRLKRWQTQHPVLVSNVEAQSVRSDDQACWLDIEVTEKEAQGFHQDTLLAMTNVTGTVVDTSPIFTGNLTLEYIPIPEGHTLVILIQDGWQKPGATNVSGHPQVRGVQAMETTAFKTLVG